MLPLTVHSNATRSGWKHDFVKRRFEFRQEKGTKKMSAHRNSPTGFQGLAAIEELGSTAQIARGRSYGIRVYNFSQIMQINHS